MSGIIIDPPFPFDFDLDGFDVQDFLDQVNRLNGPNGDNFDFDSSTGTLTVNGEEIFSLSGDLDFSDSIFGGGNSLADDSNVTADTFTLDLDSILNSGDNISFNSDTGIFSANGQDIAQIDIDGDEPSDFDLI
jgi:hypothetical protein